LEKSVDFLFIKIIYIIFCCFDREKEGIERDTRYEGDQIFLYPFLFVVSLQRSCLPSKIRKLSFSPLFLYPFEKGQGGPRHKKCIFSNSMCPFLKGYKKRDGYINF